MKNCEILNLGLIDYQQALNYQREIFKQKHTTKLNDTLIFAQHPPVYTCGRSADTDTLIKDKAAQPIQVLKVDRGGSITYHGPGQLLVYPVIKLEKDMRVMTYIRNLEHMVIRMLAVYGIKANQGEVSGVWVGKKKIASIGIKISSGITMHGISINVNCDLAPFEPILACGTDAQATSMKEILGYEIEISDVIDLVILNFGKVFNYRLIQAESEREDDEHQRQISFKN